MKRPWERNGRIIEDANGRPIECEVCPCPRFGGLPCLCCYPGTTPLRRSVAVEGVTGDGCGATFNGAHELLQGYVLSTGIGGPCAWGKHDPMPATYRIEEEVFCYGGDVYIQGFLADLTGWATFEKVVVSDTGDCSLGWGELDITANAVGDCDFSASRIIDNGPA